MRKYLLFILVCMLCFPTTFAFANNFNVVVVDNKEANPGDVATINISLENNSGLIAAIFNLEYDRERLKLIEATDGGLLESGTFSQDYSAYPYIMVWNSASTENFTDDGVLVTLKFEVLSTATAGDAYINLSYKDNNVFDVDLNNVVLKIQNGGISVKEKASESNSTGGSGHRHLGGSSISNNGDIADKTENITLKQIVLTINKNNAIVFGETKYNDVAPIIVNDRTMLPARFVAENLGASVEWFDEDQKVKITRDNVEILIFINSDIAMVNGESVTLDSPAFIENDRTYTPIRFISEQLGATVEWSEKTQQVIITKK